ncbi:hypothetical protein [Enterobacter kobei]|uniref:hypothetical protein n=1 Tax=Enterobacter kobei TaxID=208224 RepID=UPI002074D924|nr:hypothetical protein [Enterobacter kobei]MCM7139642.1 hypothetical protein [Enterobacter kobei]MCM7150697.1 hypothetical protein [Enterobacter kobei]
MTTIQYSNAAFVFTDAATGQGYMRRLTEFEFTLVGAQLAALDGGELKASPVHPVEIKCMVDEEVAEHVPANSTGSDLR